MKNGETFYSKTKKALEEFNTEIKKNELITTTTENSNEFVHLYSQYLENFKIQLTLFDKEILEHISTFSTELTKKNNGNFDLFEKIIDTVETGKKNLEKAKHNYFESSKDVVEQKEKITRMTEKKVKEEEMNHLKEVLNKLQKKSDTERDNYKKELDKMNNMLEENEKKYAKLIETIQQDEEYKLNFFRIHFVKFNEILVDEYKNRKEFSDKLDNSLKKINIKRDIKIYKNQFDCYINKIRLQKEKFLDYEFFKKGEVTSTNKNIITSSEKANTLATIESVSKEDNMKDTFICNIDISHIPKEDDGEDDIEQLFEKDSKFAPIVAKLMTSKQSISNDELGFILYEIDKKKKGAEKFIGCVFTYYKKNIYVNINCLENLHHLGNILLMIVANTLNNSEIFNLNFAIMYIAEKTVYINPDNIFNKCYLCKIISKNKVFKSRDYWTRLMKIRIAVVLDQEIKEEIEKIESLNKTENKIFSKMKNLFSSKVKENKKIENEILYNQLSEERLPSVSVKIIEDYIQHFSNFGLEISDSIDIIILLSLEYKFDREYVNYFNAELNSNEKTIKSKTAILEGIEHQVEYQALYFNETFCEDRSLVNKYEKMICYGLKYIQIKDFINILCINKQFNSHLKKIIYRNVLLKHHNMPIKDRLDIWKVLLNYHDIKKNINYKSLLQEIKEKPEEVPSREIIDLDVARTPFKTNITENRQAISNILKGIAQKCPNINYCQGMNYIAAFLLTLVGNEEESFFIYLSLLMSTEYGTIFPKDLERLKKMFYVFDRLLNILMPELYFYLKSNNVTVSYFVSPWFITMFTNAYQYIHEKEAPKVLLRIWDLFMLDGWKSILKIGISLVKHFEEKLLSLIFEELLQFLINDIIKSDFFQNKNFDTLMFISVNMDIDENLILNIENEYEIKRKIEEKNNPNNTK